MADRPPPTSNELAETRTTLAAERTERAAERTELADERTRLAVTRTMVAHDRTLMAWIRTATSLISFGFSIYKFFQALDDQQAMASGRLLGPRGFALVMIALGVGGLSLAVLEYRRQTRALRAQFADYGPYPRSLVTGIAAAVSGLGILGFVLVMLRL